MTVYRKLLKVRTTGSRATGDLRPVFSDAFPQKYAGINYVVHEYNEKENWCIIEAWCSDHPILQAHAKTMADLENLRGDPDVIEELASHPLSPPILGTLSTRTHGSVDEEKKEIVVRGIRGKFIRKQKGVDRATGKMVDEYILDEG